MAGQVDEATKAERLARLQALLEAQRFAFNRRQVGRRFDVLFDRPGRRAGQILGRSPYMQSVFAEGGPERIGAMATVEIVAAGPISLTGRLVAPTSRETSLIGRFGGRSPI